MKPLFVLLVFGLTLGGPLPAQAQTTLLNVSYDPTRELYRAFNDAFAKYWAANASRRPSWKGSITSIESRSAPAATSSRRIVSTGPRRMG